MKKKYTCEKVGSTHSRTRPTGPVCTKTLVFQKGKVVEFLHVVSLPACESSLTRLKSSVKLIGTSASIVYLNMYLSSRERLFPSALLSGRRNTRIFNRTFQRKTASNPFSFLFFLSHGVSVVPPLPLPPSINLPIVCVSVCMCFALRGQLKEGNDLFQRFLGKRELGKENGGNVVNDRKWWPRVKGHLERSQCPDVQRRGSCRRHRLHRLPLGLRYHSATFLLVPPDVWGADLRRR